MKEMYTGDGGNGRDAEIARVFLQNCTLRGIPLTVPDIEAKKAVDTLQKKYLNDQDKWDFQREVVAPCLVSNQCLRELCSALNALSEHLPQEKLPSNDFLKSILGDKYRKPAPIPAKPRRFEPTIVECLTKAGLLTNVFKEHTKRDTYCVLDKQELEKEIIRLQSEPDIRPPSTQNLAGLLPETTLEM